MTKITSILIKNRKNIQWNEVKEYMKRFQGSSYIILEYGDVISINLTSIDEYTSSNYTRRLKGTLAKSKANAVQALPDLIQNATNKRWVPNQENKHKYNASRGWYRYDTIFSIPIQADGEDEVRWNTYKGTIIVRANDKGLFFYDLINIKKEVSNPR